MIVCNEDFGGNDWGAPGPGITLSDCIDQCTNRGAECLGVTFVINFGGQCWLKYRMMPNGNPGGLSLHSAVRIGRPGPASTSTQLLLNGNFISDLSSWVVTRGLDLLSDLIWYNGAA